MTVKVSFNVVIMFLKPAVYSKNNIERNISLHIN